MIRYPITRQDLETRVQAKAPGWLEDAAARTERFRKIGRYEEADNSWGKVKEVFRELQHDKCAYCERELGNGSIECDVDHYRPKSSVKAWPTKKDDEIRASAEDVVERLLSSASGHTNCARAFCSLYKSDRPRAMKIVFYARYFLATKS